MGLFTCNNCNYTFALRERPESCPDCGKRVAVRRVSNGGCAVSSEVPAIRPATEAETLWFRRVQEELKREAEQRPA